MNTYQIANLNDLLDVPVERREACMRDLQYGLLMHELAHGGEAKNMIFGPLVWTDDDDHSVQIVDDGGNTVIAIEVIKEVML